MKTVNDDMLVEVYSEFEGGKSYKPVMVVEKNKDQCMSIIMVVTGDGDKYLARWP